MFELFDMIADSKRWVCIQIGRPPKDPKEEKKVDQHPLVGDLPIKSHTQIDAKAFRLFWLNAEKAGKVTSSECIRLLTPNVSRSHHLAQPKHQPPSRHVVVFFSGAKIH